MTSPKTPSVSVSRSFALFFAAFALLALLAPSACRAYTDYSFVVTARIDENGNAHVIEKSVFNLDTAAEREEFDNYQGLGKTTIADWRKFSKNIRYHFTGSVTNPRIIAAREFEISASAASVSVEYDVVGVFTTEKSGGRITRYFLNTEKLAFGGAGSKGEISLGNNAKFVLELPLDALEIETIPSPGVARPRRNALEWRGPIVGRWDVRFKREKPLTSEVSEFFVELYEQLSSWWTLLILAAVFFALLAFKLVKGRK
ncbi:MAG: hypothetical protein QW343_00005 [Candidatus Norongarragalinales archaeon]